MKKYVLTNTFFPSYLLYGGLFLIFFRTPLVVNGIIEQKSFFNEALFYAGIGFVLAGFILRFYHAKQSGQQKSFLISIGTGVVVLIALMATDVIHTPAFLQDLL
jgi:uncharacterized membrane protein